MKLLNKIMPNDDYQNTLNGKGKYHRDTMNLVLNGGSKTLIGKIAFEFKIQGLELLNNFTTTARKILKPQSWFSTGIYVSNYDIEILKKALEFDKNGIDDNDKLSVLFAKESDEIKKEFEKITDINDNETIERLRNRLKDKNDLPIAENIKMLYFLDDTLYTSIFYHDMGNVKYSKNNIRLLFKKTCSSLAALSFNVLGLSAIHYAPFLGIPAAGNPFYVTFAYVTDTIIESILSIAVGSNLLGSVSTLVGTVIIAACSYHKWGSSFLQVINLYEAGDSIAKTLDIFVKKFVSKAYDYITKALNDAKEFLKAIIQTKALEETVNKGEHNTNYLFDQGFFTVSINLPNDDSNIFLARNLYSNSVELITSIRYDIIEYINQGKINVIIGSCCCHIISIGYKLSILNEALNSKLDSKEINELKKNITFLNEFKMLLQKTLKSIKNILNADKKNLLKELSGLILDTGDDELALSIKDRVFDDSINLYKVILAENAYYALLPLLTGVAGEVAYVIFNCHDSITLLEESDDEFKDLTLDKWRIHLYNTVRKFLKSRSDSFDLKIILVKVFETYLLFDKFFSQEYLKSKLESFAMNIPCIPITLEYIDYSHEILKDKLADKCDFIIETFFNNNALNINKSSFNHAIKDLLSFEPLTKHYRWDFSGDTVKKVFVSDFNENLLLCFKDKDKTVDWENTTFFKILRDIYYKMYTCGIKNETLVVDFTYNNLEKISFIKKRSYFNMNYNMENYPAIRYVIRTIGEIAAKTAMGKFNNTVSQIKESRTGGYDTLNKIAKSIMLIKKPTKFFSDTIDIITKNKLKTIKYLDIAYNASSSLIERFRIKMAINSAKASFESELEKISDKIIDSDIGKEKEMLIGKIASAKTQELSNDDLENDMLIELINNPSNFTKVNDLNQAMPAQIDALEIGFTSSEIEKLNKFKGLVNNQQFKDDICKKAIEMVNKEINDGITDTTHLQIIEAVSEITNSSEKLEEILNFYEKITALDYEDENENVKQNNKVTGSKTILAGLEALKNNNSIYTSLQYENLTSAISIAQLNVPDSSDYENKINEFIRPLTLTHMNENKQNEALIIEEKKRQAELDNLRRNEALKKEENINKSIYFYTNLIESDFTKASRLVKFTDLKHKERVKSSNKIPRKINIHERVISIIYGEDDLNKNKSTKLGHNFLEDINTIEFLFKNGYGPGGEVYLSKKTKKEIDNGTYKSNPNATAPRISDNNYINSDYRKSKKPN